jgi:hypothetical protein
MEAVLKAIPTKGKLVFKNTHDAERYFIQHDGVELDVTMKPSIKVAEKIKMYNYLHGPIADAASRGYSKAGWVGVDRVKAIYLLKAELAKDFVVNQKTGETTVVIIDLKEMNKERLLKFVQDSLYFIELELQEEAPDAAEWKQYKISGKKMERI